jgi:DNA-binding LacI/PurR family transcriptional regulator
MSKYDQLAEQLKKRILEGDYSLREIPAERKLAMESGVACMTARRALHHLVEDGILIRGANGRIEINRDRTNRNSRLQLAFLCHSFPATSIGRWSNMLAEAADEINAKVRTVIYTHWDDPAIVDSLDSFDGVFLLPSSELMPAELISRFKAAKSPLVVLDRDMSGYGIPSIRQNSPVFLHRLLEHMEAQGRKNIACLNVQPCHVGIKERIEQWHLWMATRHLEGQLINEPVKSYKDPWPQAYDVIERLIKQNQFNCDALVCITAAAAVGAMRAMYDAGIRVGQDVAVGSFGGEGIAAYQVPSLTAIEPTDVSPFIKACFKWIASGGGAWNGPLLMQPTEPMLVVRESTSTSASMISSSQSESIN